MTYLEVVRPEEENDHLQEQSEDDEPKTDYKLQIVWFNVFRLSLIHVLALWGMIFSFWQIQWKTLFLVYCPTLFFSLLGITAGNHSLCHALSTLSIQTQVLIVFGVIDRIAPIYICASFSC